MHKRQPSTSTQQAKPRMKKVSKSRLEDVGDTACFVVFVLVSLAATAWLWWAVISMPSPR
jgi:hypothetical protein